jgi:hypothetical protein
MTMGKDPATSRLRIGSLLSILGGVGMAGAGWLKDNAIVQLASKVRLGDPTVPVPPGLSPETWALALESYAQLYLAGALVAGLSVYLGSFIANGFQRKFLGGIVSIAAATIGFVFLGTSVELGALPTAAALVAFVCGVVGGTLIIFSARRREIGRLR